MRVLIVYASSGSGHWKAAEALKEILSSDKRFEVALIDSLHYTPSSFRFCYPRTYIFLVRYLPSLWGLFYYLLDSPVLRGPVTRLRRLLNAANGRSLVGYVQKEDPDLVLSTHFFASEVLGASKRQGKLRAKLLTVITDFGVHVVWLSPGVDGYLVGSEEMKGFLKERGVPEGKIHVVGIPVRPLFEKKQDRKALAGKLGLDPGAFTVLISSGGFGVGPIQKLVSTLADKDSLQLLVVCGHNEGLFGALSKTVFAEGARIHLFRFVDNMDELMSVSDCMIGKSGGLTMSEALTKQLPTLILFPIPGQEDANRLFFERQRAALSMKGLREVEERFENMDSLRKELDCVRGRLRDLSFPESGQKIRDIVWRFNEK